MVYDVSFTSSKTSKKSQSQKRKHKYHLNENNILKMIDQIEKVEGELEKLKNISDFDPQIKMKRKILYSKHQNLWEKLYNTIEEFVRMVLNNKKVVVHDKDIISDLTYEVIDFLKKKKYDPERGKLFSILYNIVSRQIKYWFSKRNHNEFTFSEVFNDSVYDDVEIEERLEIQNNDFNNYYWSHSYFPNDSMEEVLKEMELSDDELPNYIEEFSFSYNKRREEEVDNHLFWKETFEKISEKVIEEIERTKGIQKIYLFFVFNEFQKILTNFENFSFRYLLNDISVSLRRKNKNYDELLRNILKKQQNNEELTEEERKILKKMLYSFLVKYFKENSNKIEMEEISLNSSNLNRSIKKFVSII